MQWSTDWDQAPISESFTSQLYCEAQLDNNNNRNSFSSQVILHAYLNPEQQLINKLMLMFGCKRAERLRRHTVLSHRNSVSASRSHKSAVWGTHLGHMWQMRRVEWQSVCMWVCVCVGVCACLSSLKWSLSEASDREEKQVFKEIIRTHPAAFNWELICAAACWKHTAAAGVCVCVTNRE